MSAPPDIPPPPNPIELGAFSVSLNVADLDRSRAFYELLGFGVTGGNADENWLILRNGDTTIGLFSGMFDKNILTFNPGLHQDMSQPESFTDVREIQARLVDAGVALTQAVESDEGPGHFVVEDPDGNPVMVDQFF